jgi:hypothetical protein
METTTIKITGLGWGLGLTGKRYDTVTDFTSSTITFEGTPGAILADVARVRRTDKLTAAASGLKGRNSVSSGAIAIEKRVRKALAA